MPVVFPPSLPRYALGTIAVSLAANLSHGAEANGSWWLLRPTLEKEGSEGYSADRGGTWMMMETDWVIGVHGFWAISGTSRVCSGKYDLTGKFNIPAYPFSVLAHAIQPGLDQNQRQKEHLPLQISTILQDRLQPIEASTQPRMNVIVFVRVRLSNR